MAYKGTTRLINPSHAFLLLAILITTCSAESEADVLIKIKESLKNTGGLDSWQITTPPCDNDKENWVGLLCDNGTVWGLRLENMELDGTINVETLMKLPKLRMLSFANNNFNGPLPDLSKRTSLKAVFLSRNKFSGVIPENMFTGMFALKKVHLQNNQLSGPIPESLATLPRLMELLVQNNQLSGEIPEFPRDKIKAIDLSHNKLEGEIPYGLSNFQASAFEGNKDLCGIPLRSCTAPTELSMGTIITVIVLVVIASLALVVVVIILVRRKKPTNMNIRAVKPTSSSAVPRQVDHKAAELDRMEQGHAGAHKKSASSSSEKTSHAKKSEAHMKITFLRDDRGKFDMSDLLKASAEVLGSGVFGATYKADIGTGAMFVVKRFKHMNNVNKEDFTEHMRRLGRLSHPNLLPLVGYYYRREEKLFVADYVENFSLAVHLHGTNSRNHSSLKWPARLRIIKGVANGLMYLYNELPSLMAPHGHLKSSNVLLDSSNSPLLGDYGLVPIVNLDDAAKHMISYKSPEFVQSGRITKKTDVWSLGILIIEILTGKFPPNFMQQGPAGKSVDTDIAAWVESVVGAEPSPEVLDKSMTWRKQCEPEMMKLLNIGLSFCQTEVDMRPDMREAVEKIEEVKEGDR